MLFGVAWLFLLSSAGLAQQSADDDLLARITAAGQVRPGLCVVVGCGDGTLAADLARTERYQVHALAADRRTVAAARARIRSEGLYGTATVSFCPLDELPYADNLANLLVVEDLTAAMERGLSVEEIVRVLAPYGTAFLGNAAELDYPGARNKNGWTMLVKPYPEAMDEWRQYRHGPTRAAISSDTMVTPATSLRWIGGDYWAHRPLQQTVSANGRNFYLIRNDTERLEDPPGVRIVARDAFNGLQLWERRLDGFPDHNTAGPLVAAGDRLYLAGLGNLRAFDAATGELVKDYGFGTRDVTYHDGMLITGPGRHTAYDAETGEKLWQSGLSGYGPGVFAGGRVYVEIYGHEELGCAEMGTGREVWRVPIPEDARGGLLCYRDGILFVKGGAGFGRARGRNSAFSAEDGRYLWNFDYPLSGHGGRPDLFFLAGLAWVHKGNPKRATYGESWIGVDPRTGEVAEEVRYGDGQKVKHRCYGERATETYILCGGMDFFDVSAREHYAFHGARGACGFGYFPANGLVYGAPTLCHCFAHVRDFSALAGGPLPDLDGWDASADERIERGTGRPAGIPSAPNDWPTFRKEAGRGACTEASVPVDLDLRWDRKIGSDVSVPVAAAGAVYVASVRDHRVVALDEESGEMLWEYQAGGRVDSPPTVTDGMAIFGCRDGTVHCLAADTGELIWRFRAAPADKRIVSYGQVESAWPVHGSVLVMGETAYFAAGRQSEVDGGIFLYAADVRTGRLRWSRQVIRDPLFRQTSVRDVGNEMNDILSSDGETVYMRRKMFDVATGEESEPTSYYIRGGTVGFLRDIARPPYGWKHEFQRQWTLRQEGTGKGTVMGSTFAWRGEDVFGVSNDRGEMFHSDEKGRRDWTVEIPPESCPKAVILAGENVIVAAMPDADDATRGEVWVHSAADGRRLSTIALPAAPRFDALAAVPGSLFVGTQDGRVLCLGAASPDSGVQ